MSTVTNINPEKEPIPQSWVPRVITGGKEPPSEYECWLERLPVGTVFIAGDTNDVYGKLYELIFKGEHFYLIHMMIDDTANDLYINPRKWCSVHREYEILHLEGENNEQRNRSD